MPITVEAHVESLLTRQVAEAKMGGAARPDLEAAAVFDSITMGLLLHPRAVLYLMALARNALIQAVQAELDAVDALDGIISDLANPAYRIEGAPVLERARTALLNLENLPGVGAEARSLLDAYSGAVDEFLNNHLAKNVRRKGATELTRPAAEALALLPAAVTALKSLHADTLDRLYTIAVGVENFESAPFSALLGTTTVARARADIEDIVSQVRAGGSPAAARDFALRLLGSQATVGVVSRPPRWSDPVLDAAPAISDDAHASVTSSSSSFAAAPGDPPFQVQVAGSTLAFTLFPAGATLLTTPLSFPLTIGAGLYLFLDTDGAVHEISLTGTYASLAALAAHLTTGGISAAPIGERLCVYASAAALSVLPHGIVAPDGSVVGTSAAQLVGLRVGQVGTSQLAASDVAYGLNILFGALITASVDSDQRVTITALDGAPGTVLTVTCGAGYGLAGTARAGADLLTVADAGEVQPGDSVLTPTGAAVVETAAATRLLLSTPLDTFVGPVTVKSALVETYRRFISALKRFLKSWSALPFAKDLSSLDQALAPLISSQSAAQRNEALVALGRLRTEVTKLLNVLQDPSTMLPVGAGAREKDVVDGILNTLSERGFTRAADALLRGDLHSMLEMDHERASYGGEFMRAASALAQSFNTASPVDTEEPAAVSAGTV